MKINERAALQDRAEQKELKNWHRCDRMEKRRRDREKRERWEKERSAEALLHFLIEPLSGQVNLHSMSGCRLLPRQINIDSLQSAFSSSWSTGKEDGFQSWTRRRASSSFSKVVGVLKKKFGFPSLLLVRQRSGPETFSLFTTLSVIHRTTPLIHCVHTRNPGNPQCFNLISICWMEKLTSWWKWVKNII